MPRHIKATAKKVQLSRRDWYTFHFDNHEKVKNLPSEILHKYQYVASMIESPTMTIFGGLPGDYPKREAFELCGKHELDANLLNSWYLSEDGWNAFQDLWSQLPEPVDLYTTPCVQIGELYTLYTMPSESETPKEHDI